MIDSKWLPPIVSSWYHGHTFYVETVPCFVNPHQQPVAAWMPRWEFYYCNLQMLRQNKIVTTVPPCRIFSFACFILGDPHPQEPPGPQLNSQPAFLILVKYLCGVGLFGPRWWAEIRGRYPEFREQRWKRSSIGNMPCIAESKDDKFEADRSTGRWFEASFEVCLSDVKSSPKLDQTKKVLVNTSEWFWQNWGHFGSSPHILNHHVKMLLSRHSFREDAFHHFPWLSFSPKAFSRFQAAQFTNLYLLSGFGNHSSPITSQKIRLLI